jgi:hypothetical protein
LREVIRRTRKVTKGNRCIKKEHEAKEKMAAIRGGRKSGKAMKEDAIIIAMKR